jgi:hypothetical protein
MPHGVGAGARHREENAVSRICLYYRRPPEIDRWIFGDRFVRPIVRRVIRGRYRPGGIDKIFGNLCLGLDRLGQAYEFNLPFNRLHTGDRIGVFGVGRGVLAGYDQPYRIVAGNGMMSHPSEWPTLCDDYPVATYFLSSDWVSKLFEPHFGERCQVWPVGIDTHNWHPNPGVEKTVDFLLYDKIRWERERLVPQLLEPIRDALRDRGLSFVELRYGFYTEPDYRAALRQAAAMIFLCEHETQGLACEECLASDVPVLAWDQGRCLDANRFAWGAPDIPATSVPYFDARCGLRFRNIEEFPERLEEFRDRARGRAFAPRQYILENLTLERCSARFIDLLDQANG